MIAKKPKRNANQKKVGVIIVSFSLDNEKTQMTKRAVDTCVMGAAETEGVFVKVVVAEQNKDLNPETYSPSEVFFHEVSPFNYNEVLNKTRHKFFGGYDYVVFCNNDLIFFNGWLEELLKSDGDVVSPRHPNHPLQQDVTKDIYGYEVAKHFNGWCFALSKKAMEEIGDFSTEYPFWFADNIVVKQLKDKGFTPILSAKSTVKHIGSVTLNDQEKIEKHNITYGYLDKYEKDTGEQTDINLKSLGSGKNKEGTRVANSLLPRVR